MMAAALVSLAACGQGASLDHARPGGKAHHELTLKPAGTGAPERISTNWRNPESGDRVRSISTAARIVPYPILVPSAFGLPRRVFVSRHDPASQDGVQAIFSTPSGLVDIEQGPPPLPQDEWVASDNALIAAIGEPGIQGTAGWVDLGDGVSGFWTQDEAGGQADIRWLASDGTVLIYVTGKGMNLAELTPIAQSIVQDSSVTP
jgi:hypothetical protein